MKKGDMNMTNAMIILLESVDLMEQGILQGTGEFITVEDAEGNEKQLEIPEPIHTFAMWKSMGYKVKKGEHAIAKFPIWKMSKGKKKTDDDEEQKGRMFLKTSHFFKASQVEKVG